MLQSHAHGLAAQGRRPPFQLVGARWIVQWDMIFRPDAPFGWVGPCCKQVRHEPAMPVQKKHGAVLDFSRNPDRAS